MPFFNNSRITLNYPFALPTIPYLTLGGLLRILTGQGIAIEAIASHILLVRGAIEILGD
jgi:uncharacterized membrane protein